MSRFFAGAATLAFAAAFSLPSHANDTQAEIALGGLTLKHSDSIRMDSEDLYVSRDRVRVTYRFTNTSDQPIETLVAFPLPDIPPDDMENKAFWSSRRPISSSKPPSMASRLRWTSSSRRFSKGKTSRPGFRP
ncbi:DUF4424 domain-containing protein [Methylocystis sp. MJC1]|uniref:DUF4424 family protein n=1 Tax=Methylocystis sp. MJC1 TaxID=2654282 RepID=UPI0013EB7847|nr:DUF4424 family protein [Methylocystis sp. MJC1]KAF2991606.1 hypothetical protein MJC1_01171 [Methylocystis sp. MJC1]MBU6527155.1 DUF4424 family protein [Methylocystis sp. MJC1]UZX13588.1 DUF4424 domain-containing protein [Methylocystis sp. MJC1]